MRKYGSCYSDNPPSPRGICPAGGDGFSHLENMYVDYGSGEATVESIVGYRKALTLHRGIHSFCTVGNEGAAGLVIHSADALYLASKKEGEARLPLRKIAEMDDKESFTVSLGESCIVSDGRKIIWVNSSGEVKQLSDREDVAGCRCAVYHKGRLFLSGCPAHPLRVFFTDGLTECGEISFSCYDEIASEKRILSLISVDGYLFTLLSSGVEGEIICRDGIPAHTSAEKAISKLPPFTAGFEFDRRLMLMTRDGLAAIDLSRIWIDPSPVVCSANINAMLMKEKGDPIFTEWMGYLVIAFGSSLYLADTRWGGWEWYFISDIGGYRGDARVYRYLGYADEGCLAHPSIGQAAEGEVFSRGGKDGLKYYVRQGDKCYSVYPTAEMRGGELLPPRQIMGCGSLLWFSTEDGHIYLFNNDRRGKAPTDIPFHENTPGWDKPIGARDIHPIYYSFAGHPPTYAAITHPGGEDEDEVTVELCEMSEESITLTDLSRPDPSQRRKIAPKKPISSAKADNRDEKTRDRNAVFTTVRLKQHSTRNRIGGLCISSSSFAAPFGIRSVTRRKTKKERKT